eukprot:jgi/Picsp_1/6463/NSC_03810-R1_protein
MRTENAPSGSARSYHTVHGNSKEEGQEVAALRVSEQGDAARSPDSSFNAKYERNDGARGVGVDGKGQDGNLLHSRQDKGHADARGSNGMGGAPGGAKEMERKSLGSARFTLVDVESDEEMDMWPDEDRSAPVGTETVGVSRGKGQEQSEQPSLDSRKGSSDTGSSGYDSDDEDIMGLDGDMFVKHKIKKKDTLAGLAVKYKVSISDIKRANGFQTDTAMFGKEWLLIPKKPFSIGPEHAAWAGMIIAHYERGPYYAGESSHRALDALSALQGYYSNDSSPIQGMTYGFDDLLGGGIGNVLPESNKKNDDEYDRYRGGGREVEMMARASSKIVNCPSYIEDRLRRRKNDDAFERDLSFSRDYEEDNDPATRQVFDALRERNFPQRPPLFSSELSSKISNAWRTRSSSFSVGAMKELKDLRNKSVKWKDQLVSKIKKAASQPAMTSTFGNNNNSSGQGLFEGPSFSRSLGRKND